MGNKYYEFDDAKKLIKSFLDSQFPECGDLDEKLEKLQDFSFWDITEKEKYRNNKYYIDGDCTNLAYAIAWCLWEKDIKKSSGEDYTFEKLLDEEDFSGDTICTWNTLFNDPHVLLKIDFSGEEKKKIFEFYKLYQSIGNFYLLPNKTNGKSSLNTYRGNYYGLKDYFDLFRDALISGKNKNIEDILKENKFFSDGPKTNWEKLRDTFYLQATENLKFKDKHYKHSDLTDKNKSEYKEFILDFVTQSTEMIKTRAEEIIKKLKEIEELKEFSKE